MKKAFTLILMTICLGIPGSYAQKAAVKTNLLYDATSTFKIGRAHV